MLVGTFSYNNKRLKIPKCRKSKDRLQWQRRTNNDLENTTQNTKDRTPRIPTFTGGGLR